MLYFLSIDFDEQTVFCFAISRKVLSHMLQLLHSFELLYGLKFLAEHLLITLKLNLKQLFALREQ